MELLRRICRKVFNFFKYSYQTLAWGFNDAELADLDVTTADFLLPRLTRFKKVWDVIPDGLTSEEWEKILDTIIETFRIISEEDKYIYDSTTDLRITKGLDLYRKYFFNFWV